ncbi:MAG: hypothetical protein Q7U53_03185 [Anaerolineaceae bacterium]|nr:hypothetical protein [Anaerolineaceae bacterium]
MPAVKRCPSLGLNYDQYTFMTVANNYHYCYHLAKPKTIALGHQNEYCLSENHVCCPIFLSGERIFPLVIKPKPTENLTVQSSTRFVFLHSMTQLITFLAVLTILAFTTWYVFAKTNLFTSTDPSDQTSENLPHDRTPSMTQTVNLFTPNPTLINELTVQAIKISWLSQTPPITTTGQIQQTPSRTKSTTRTPTVVVCSKPDGWIVYKVKVWDTLVWLSRWVRTPVGNLMEANCLTTQNLSLGQEIYLPYYPRIATNTPTYTATSDGPDNTHTPAPTNTRTRTSTLTSIPTATRNPIFSNTRTPTKTLIHTLTRTFTNTIPPTATFATKTPTATITNTPPLSPTTPPPPAPSDSPEPTPSDTPEPTVTNTPEPTPTETLE